MIELKCPVCKTGNIKKYADGQHYACDNEDCPSYDETDERTFDILITTRKALDIAINVLNRVKDVKYEEYIDEKLEQITALQQKEEQ